MAGESRYWFPAKRYGWGWGPPIRWQGWAVVAVFVAAMVGTAVISPPTAVPLQFWGGFALLNALLIGVCWLTGEPPRWRWGNDGNDTR